MENRKNQGNSPLDEFILGLDNQELKSILLKLKNEIKKPDVPWADIRTILTSLYKKDKDAFHEILSIIVR